MTKTHKIEIVLATIAVALTIVQVATLKGNNPPEKVPAQPVNPCPDAKPCIELTDADGHKYKLNDFRFQPNHCISFISLPDDTSRKVCGDYYMNWIGPTGDSDTTSQSI